MGWEELTCGQQEDTCRKELADVHNCSMRKALFSHSVSLDKFSVAAFMVVGGYADGMQTAAMPFRCAGLV